MINIKRFTCNMLAENCYVVSDETKQAVIIDCGAFYQEGFSGINNYLKTLNPTHLLCTHGHFDHCMGNGLVYKAYGLKPEVHHEDDFLMEGMAEQTRDILGVSLPFEVPPVGRYFSDDDTITFGSHELKILHTPGHTPGGVVFYCKSEQVAFTGDTLFRMSIGRTDFERGSYEQMMTSLKHLKQALPGNTKLYPGHGPESLMADETMYNPYFK